MTAPAPPPSPTPPPARINRDSQLPGDTPLHDWQSSLQARLANFDDARHRPGARQPYPTTRFSLITYLPLKALVDEAAAARGIGRTSYVRRALASLVAYDLSLPFPDTAQYLTYPSPPGRGPDPYAAAHPHAVDPGTGYGPWQIAQMHLVEGPRDGGD